MAQYNSNMEIEVGIGKVYDAREREDHGTFRVVVDGIGRYAVAVIEENNLLVIREKGTCSVVYFQAPTTAAAVARRLLAARQ